MIPVVVSDTGPLISFEKIEGGFALVRRMVGVVLVPPQVYMELSAGLPLGTAYSDHFGLSGLLRVVEAPVPPEATRGLDDGERHAIALALSQDVPLLIEERQGREVALELGLHVSGAVGLILAAWQDRRILQDEAESALRDLFRAGRINRGLLDLALARILGH
ncbi:hypothetical protein [Magnetospirillum moscoviense]|uniref:Nucleic acid-binding protein n=1 Tax=Magnetospirillum moscoviense TaxID=1437059 RepID=A0A178MFU6_9PROT|nr:hypothetical protein [Magnetospirillum moscoviense]OAN47426.1 hypothetical protein A6A05_15725 [Magnetospirillum moscoviense]